MAVTYSGTHTPYIFHDLTQTITKRKREKKKKEIDICANQTKPGGILLVPNRLWAENQSSINLNMPQWFLGACDFHHLKFYELNNVLLDKMINCIISCRSLKGSSSVRQCWLPVGSHSAVCQQSQYVDDFGELDPQSSRSRREFSFLFRSLECRCRFAVGHPCCITP